MCEAEMLQWKKGTGFILPIWGRIIHLTFPRVSRHGKSPWHFQHLQVSAQAPRTKTGGRAPWLSLRRCPWNTRSSPRRTSEQPPRKIQRFSGTEDHGKPSLFHADFLGLSMFIPTLDVETGNSHGKWLAMINQGSDQWITGLSVAEHGGWAPKELPLHHGINWGHHVRQTHMKVR